MENNIVITIARQYGSGGKTIGKMLAERMQVPFYDKELMRLASDESGINETLFAGSDEKVKNSLLHNYQAKIIRELANRESCVIIGRCADYVLKEYDNVLSVFVHAPHDFCMEQAAKKHSISERELEKLIAKTDRQRAGYYKYHTGRDWTDARNYDLCLDSSKLGFERCVEEILAYIKVRFA